MTVRRIVLCSCVFLATTSAVAGQAAFAQHPKLPKAPLNSPYLGDKKEYTLPLDNRLTIVVLVDSARTLVPMELIRGLRLVEKFGDRIRLATVFVCRDPKIQADVETAIEQSNLLATGLKTSPRFTALVDRSGGWYDELGQPGLPHAMLVSTDGEILDREILLGGFSAEVTRIDRNLDPSPSTSANPTPGDAVTNTIAESVRNVALLPDKAKAARISRRERAMRRIDAPQIMKKLAASHPDTALSIVRGYCESTSSFSLAHRFANELLAQPDSNDCGWAKEMIDSRVEGLVAINLWQLDVSISVENPSPDLRMWVSAHCTLESRWNGNKVAELRQSGFFNPGSDVYVTNDKFLTMNAGWGDYVVHNKIEVSMSEGEYPNNHIYPTLTREWMEGVTYFPRNEYAEEVNLNNAKRSPELIAFRDGLNQSLQTALRQSASRQSGLTDLVSSANLSRVGQWLGNQSRQLTGSDRGVGQPFKKLNVTSWVQGQELFDSGGAGPLVPPKGRALLVDFMFVSCPPCQAALPELSALHEEFRERGLVVVSLTTSWGSRGIFDLAKKKAAKHAFAILAENEERQYGVNTFPTLLLVDRLGKVRWSKVGELPPRKLIQSILDEAP